MDIAKNMTIKLQRSIEEFVASEEGTASMEATLWMPVFVLVFALIVDVTMIFQAETKIMRVVHDGNRLVAAGYFDNEADAQIAVQQSLSEFTDHAQAVVEIIGDTVLTTVTVPASDFAIIGLIPGIDQTILSVSAKHVVIS